LGSRSKQFDEYKGVRFIFDCDHGFGDEFLLPYELYAHSRTGYVDVHLDPDRYDPSQLRVSFIAMMEIATLNE